MATNGSWLMFPHVNLKDVKRVNFQVHGQGNPAGPPTGANWTLRVGSPTGPIAARSQNLPATGETFWIFQPQYRYSRRPVTDPGGVHDLYIVVDYAEGVQVGSITLQNFEFVTETPTSVTASVNAPNGTNGWHRTAPQVTSSDQPASVWPRQVSVNGGQTWTNANATTGVASITTQGTFDLLYRVADNAGVVAATGSAPIPLKVDTTAPTATIIAPAAGAQLVQGFSYAADYSCADATSGIAACTGTVANGAPVDTTTPGVKTLSVTATDNAGNTRTVTRSYTVLPSTTVGGTVPATLSLDGHARELRRVHSRRRQGLHRLDHRHDHLHRG